ncbi:hypothetical protein B7494_g1830 [Chlorociboria aeruginascens]|nr:hypothetical protein B7494_g1830 [Chlorociboria aeruginascens]
MFPKPPPHNHNIALFLDIAKVSIDFKISGLLNQFIEAGGVVLACPAYSRFCTYDTIRLRKSDVTQFVRFDKCYLPHEIPITFKYIADRCPGEGLHVSVHAVKKSGVTKILTRLIGRPGYEGEDPALWKWLFADLKEDENLDTVVREKSRWGWAGRFRVDFELECESVVVSDSITPDSIITISDSVTPDATKETTAVKGQDETGVATDDVTNGKATDNVTAHNEGNLEEVGGDSDDDNDSVSTKASTITSSATQVAGDLFTLY